MRPFKIGIALFLILSLNLCVSKPGYVPGIIDRISIPTEGRWQLGMGGTQLVLWL